MLSLFEKRKRKKKKNYCWNSYSLLQVLVDMVRVPDWAFEAAGQELRRMGQDAAAYQPGPYLTPAQVELKSNCNKRIYRVQLNCRLPLLPVSVAQSNLKSMQIGVKKSLNEISYRNYEAFTFSSAAV